MSRQRAGTSLAEKAKAKAEVGKKREAIQREKNKISGNAADKVMRERKVISEVPLYSSSENQKSTSSEFSHHTELNAEIINHQIITDRLVSDDLGIDHESVDLGARDTRISSRSPAVMEHSIFHKSVTGDKSTDQIITDELVTDQTVTGDKSTDQIITDELVTDQTVTGGSAIKLPTTRFDIETISLLDKLHKADLSGGEYKFVFSLIKASNFDWDKGIELSLIELEEMTGGGQSYVVRLLKRLVDKGVLTKKPTAPKAKSNYVLTF